MSKFKYLANLIFKKTVQKQSGIMKITPVDKFIAEKQAKSVIDKLKANNIDVNNLSKSDLNIMAEQIVHPLKYAEEVLPKKSADILPFKFKRSFAEELAAAGEKGDFTRMSGIMKLDPKFKEVMKNVEKQKVAEALAKERAPNQPILEKMFYQTDEIPTDPIKKLKYSGLSEDQYKNVLKHGRTLDDVIYARDRSGMTIPQVMEAIEKKGPFPFAGGGIAGMLGEPTYEDDNHRVPLAGGGDLFKLLKFLKGPKDKPFNVKDFVDKREFILSLIGQSSKQKNKKILAEMLEESEKIRKNPSFKFPDTGTGSDFKNEIEMILSKDITKHADGGRVPLGKGKRVLDLGLKFLNKVFSKDRMKEMRTQDPELYQGLLEVVDKFRARDKTGLIKYMKKYLPHMDDAEIEDFITASDTGDIYGQLIRLGSGRDYKGKMEMIKKLEKANMLKDFDVGKATKHATGGRVPFSKGKKVLEGLAKLFDEFFPGTTKLGQRSKPYPEKVQEKMDLRKAIADFQEREKVAKFKEMKKADGGLAGMLGE